MSEEARRRKAILCEKLRRDVATLALAPGVDLDETRLSAEFGLSRTPLREVFRQLAGEGYLILRENRGARVSDMTFQTLRDFFLAAPMIYAAITRLAAENATREQIAALKEAQRRFRVAMREGSTGDRTLANNAFHMITNDMADNVYLAPSMRRLMIDHARLGMTFYDPRGAVPTENLARACDQHDAMIACIEGRDAAGAEALAKAHWALSRDHIERFVTPQSLDAPIGAVMGMR